MRASSTYTDGTLRFAANFKPKVKLKYQGYFTVDAAPSRSAVCMELAVIATDSILVSFVLRIDIPDRPDAISAERRRPGRREPPKHAIGDDGQESFDSTRSLGGETLGISSGHTVYRGSGWERCLAALIVPERLHLPLDQPKSGWRDGGVQPDEGTMLLILESCSALGQPARSQPHGGRSKAARWQAMAMWLVQKSSAKNRLRSPRERYSS
ncbi:hypothetical protein ACSS6W_006253 [Trichoderma asperelloides]